jgi:hypothetical protein
MNYDNIKSIKIADMQIGQTVCVPIAIRYGWATAFRYCKYREEVVKRITPKKTKVIFESGLEYTEKEISFYEPCEEIRKMSEIAKAFENIGSIAFKFRDISSISAKYSDEDIMELYKGLLSAYKVIKRNEKDNEG